MVATWFQLQEVTVQVDSLPDKLSSNIHGILALVGKPIYNPPSHIFLTHNRTLMDFICEILLLVGQRCIYLFDGKCNSQFSTWVKKCRFGMTSWQVPSGYDFYYSISQPHSWYRRYQNVRMKVIQFGTVFSTATATTAGNHCSRYLFLWYKYRYFSDCLPEKW